MIILLDTHAAVGDLADEIAKLERLLADLRRIAVGDMPTDQELAAAPLIDQWVGSVRSEPCLVGHITGHPRLPGSISTTSGIWVMAPELGWARTHNRFYRLGRHILGKASNWRH